ncbi:MAG: gephyrin-like molybdotransferase Glp [Gemmatimonadales bacterium]
MTAPLSPRDAVQRILHAIQVQPPLRVPLADALGSVLAEPITSPLDIPAWTNSAMDGYAARAEDVRGASAERPLQLQVIEQIPAGSFPSRTIGPGECARIFTGAPLPEGADTVVRQEDTDYGAKTVTITNDRDAGVNIRLAGEDIRKGAQVLAAGDELTPARLGVLASLAVAAPLVHRRPRVAILGSGDEIVDIDQPEEILSGRKVASSNTHTLAALIRMTGGVPVNLGIARDTPESLRAHLELAFACDLLVTTAGISVGEHDYLRSVLESMGMELGFWKLKMRPGAPVGFGMLAQGEGRREKGEVTARAGDPASRVSLPTARLPWIGLPGNPVSTMVTFELFVRPTIRKMMGHRLPFRRTVPVSLAEPVKVGATLQHFLRAVVTPTDDGRHSARLTGPQGSGILTSMILANALLIIPEGQPETAAGAIASALLLDDPHHLADPPY